MNNPKNKLAEIFLQHDIHQYQNTKVNNLFPIFNLLLTINVLVMATSLGVIVAHLITKLA